MNRSVPDELLRRLRNEIAIEYVIEHHLAMPSKRRDGLLRFVCPICTGSHTATNRATNLARCFTCRRNFNPIDLVIEVEGCSFLEAVATLEPFISAARPARSRGS